MRFTYLVPAMQQVSRMTCLPTAIWMLHRWYLDKIGAHAATPIFEAIVNVSQKQFEVQEQQLKKTGESIAGGLNEKNLSEFVRRAGFASDSINVTSQSFENQLRQYGPFVYITRLSNDQLPIDLLMKSIGEGSRYDHALLVTGIQEQHSITTLYFNDPGAGKSRSMEFFTFVTTYRPLRGLDKVLIIYIKP